MLIFDEGTKGFKEALGCSGNLQFNCSITEPSKGFFALELEYHPRIDTDVVTTVKILGITSAQLTRMIGILAKGQKLLEAKEIVNAEEHRLLPQTAKAV